MFVGPNLLEAQTPKCMCAKSPEAATPTICRHQPLEAKNQLHLSLKFHLDNVAIFKR